MTVFGFTLGEAAVLLGFLVTVIGGFLRLQMAAKHNARTAEDALRVARDVRQEINVLKLDVAEKYASVEHLKEVETRLAFSIDRLTDRIDQFLTSIGK